MTRPKRSIYETLRYFSEEEIQENIAKANKELKLGIQIIYDGSEDGEYPANIYNSYAEYSRDKDKAHYLILTNKPIPQDLEDKLIRARIELENEGLLEPYTEITMNK